MTMNACEKFIEKLNTQLPEMCRVADLVKHGIYSNATDAMEGRMKGDHPPYIQCKNKGKILYPKDGVIDWLKGKIHVSQ